MKPTEQLFTKILPFLKFKSDVYKSQESVEDLDVNSNDDVWKNDNEIFKNIFNFNNVLYNGGHKIKDKYIDLIAPKLQQTRLSFEIYCKSRFDDKTLDSKSIREFPKCSAYLIKRACQCDQVCIDKNISNLKYDPSCVIFDLENVNTDVSYLDSCDRQALRPYDGTLKLYKFGFNIERATKELNDSVIACCRTLTYAPDLICNAYELRDECKNEKFCMSKNFIVPGNCTLNFNKIKEILGIEKNGISTENLVSSTDNPTAQAAILMPIKDVNYFTIGLSGACLIIFLCLIVVSLFGKSVNKKIFFFSVIGVIIVFLSLILTLY
ncbi:putative SP-containing membrane protein [Vairimorpha necatrix]|uniref:SP-containing membrane protein n=1 Tax=Vairimorpha necatrix TaxID=6039 RepID=A0AAX4JEQ2_9MICR